MSRLCATVLSAGLLLGSPVITVAQNLAASISRCWSTSLAPPSRSGPTESSDSSRVTTRETVTLLLTPQTALTHSSKPPATKPPPAPENIRHRIEGTTEGDSTPSGLDLPAVPIRGQAVRIGAPLRGDRWLAANGPSNDTHHRRSWLAHQGRAFAPERFAIDFVTVRRRSHEGRSSENRSTAVRTEATRPPPRPKKARTPQPPPPDPPRDP